jgi:orotate phosphoribosyltransferase
MVQTMQNLKTDLMEHFLNTNSFKHDPINKFTLFSGVQSDFYIDCRTVVADPLALAKIGEYSYQKVKSLKFDCIGGLELGAIAIAAIISHYGWQHEQKWPNFVVRKQAKGHGLGKKIEGIVRPGAKALIVDDVLTSGRSILQAVDAARQVGLIVDHALVIVDRQEQDGERNLAKEGVKLISLLTIKDFQSIERLTPALSI